MNLNRLYIRLVIPGLVYKGSGNGGDDDSKTGYLFWHNVVSIWSLFLKNVVSIWSLIGTFYFRDQNYHHC
jgi:hypothetical protein